MKTETIHDAISNGVSNMSGQAYWDSLDSGDSDWNDWIIMAQREGVDAVVEELNSTAAIMEIEKSIVDQGETK